MGRDDGGGGGITVNIASPFIQLSHSVEGESDAIKGAKSRGTLFALSTV